MEVIAKCKGFCTKQANGDKKQSRILCPTLQRLVAVLNYYNSLMLNAVDGDETLSQNRFIDFCDKYYGQKWLMEDHMHFIANHNDFASTLKMAGVLEYKCFGDLKQCTMTTRHYRNRQRGSQEDVHFYIDIMDSLHFNLLHLEDAGLRVRFDANQKLQKTDGLVDQKMLRIKREIQLKRQQTVFPRIDATAKNSKFSLCSTVENNVVTKGGMTEVDSVLKDFQKEVGDEAAVHRLVKFMEEQRYDTETMNEDMAVYAESKQCNVRKAMENHGDGEGFEAIRRWLRYHRISGSPTFSTGIWWAYWPWYRTQTIESLMSRRDSSGVNRWKRIEFGGHSLQSLCVYPKFENLKEEAMNSGLISLRFWRKLNRKASHYLQSTRCKKMVDDGTGALLKFGVPFGFKVTLSHLVALLLYTDSSAYCTALSETFRAIESGETIEEMNTRNSMYYWTSRYLRELVHCFGVKAGAEKKVFFTGISYEMSIPQFQIGLIGPTSMSMAKEVAVRFAGENGMLIALKGGMSKCFNASPFSTYPEEQERIFFGSTGRETVTSVILVKSAHNYRAAIGAYSKFDAVFSGKRYKRMRPLELDIITESLRWINGDDVAVNHRNLDIFILETFYSFIIHKKMVYLNMALYSKEDHVFNMVVNRIGSTQDDENSKLTNIFSLKPMIFTLFRDVHQITISTWNHRFDLISLLRTIKNVKMPRRWEIIIADGYNWLNEGFNEKMTAQYAAAGIQIMKKKVRRMWSARVVVDSFCVWCSPR